MSTNAHIINHTHWDREWFLTSIYTTQWIPTLIDNLERIAQNNPDFRYLLDGQTLIIEDLIALDPSYEARARKLIEQGNLAIGPYYCQPDWQLTGGELHLRNLLYGAKDVQKYGGERRAGWLVDTFGHISQAPQIHQMFGLDAVFVWRGVPQLAAYFRWMGSDGSELRAVDLFGGYRNLYGVSHAPDVAVRRLQSEVDKLSPFYPTKDIPLFDGYDLEDEPEDSVGFFAERVVPETIALSEATPASFVEAVWPKLNGIPTISGELNSGKFGATFPGTFSARTYLKVMAYDCATLLFGRCEPLAALAGCFERPFSPHQHETYSRLLLQNAVHDCICGVSIDMVHEKMEDIYRRVFDEMTGEIDQTLTHLMGGFAAGSYAVSTNPFPFDGHLLVDDLLYHVKTDGVGVYAVNQAEAAVDEDVAVTDFAARGCLVRGDGTVQCGDAVLGRLAVFADAGDTYSDETGELLGLLLPTTPLRHIASSAAHDVLWYASAFDNGDISVEATVQIALMDGEMPRWQIDLDSSGVNFRVDFVCETAVSGQIHAGMPFDTVARQPQDSDLLPRDLEDSRAKIFMGQRELNEVRSFPFHEYVGIGNDERTVVVLAKGINAYQADADGTLRIILRRSSEWLTKANLENRIGDAGPFFYVPDARCERVVRHELGVLVGNTAVTSPQFQQINHAFHHPPLLVTSEGSGDLTELTLFQENAPLSILQMLDGKLIARGYNPTDEPITLSQTYQTVDPFGGDLGETAVIAPKQIISLVVPFEKQPQSEPTTVQLHNAAPWRVGANGSRPDPVIIEELEEKTAVLQTQIEQIEAKLTNDPDNYQLQWQMYAYRRERLEYLLSAHLSKLKLANGDSVPHDYLYAPDPTIVKIGGQLNKMRIKRRIFDYVIAAL